MCLAILGLACVIGRVLCAAVTLLVQLKCSFVVADVCSLIYLYKYVVLAMQTLLALICMFIHFIMFSLACQQSMFSCISTVLFVVCIYTQCWLFGSTIL